jgi:hypothetical protein
MAKPSDTTKKKDFNKSAAAGKKKKPGRTKLYIGGGVGLFALLIAIVAMFPNYGTINYGICKTYVELYEPYPPAIKWVWAWDDRASTVGIGYKRTDPFGIELSYEITCTVKTDENDNITLESVDINGKRQYPQESAEAIKKFNVGLYGLFAYPPDLTMPSDFPADIKDYR